jgi:hypothetical protein
VSLLVPAWGGGLWASLCGEVLREATIFDLSGVASASVDELSALLLPRAKRESASRPDVAPKDQRCGSEAKTSALFGPRRVTCVRARDHEGNHASIPVRAFPRVRQFCVYIW